MARLILESKETSLPISTKRLVVIFQPHRFTRTKSFHNEFAQTLIRADAVILAPVYAAGEKGIEGINSQSIAKLIKNKNQDLPVFAADDFSHLIQLVKKHTYENDLIINMGAGDINKLWSELIKNEPKENYSESNIAA